jgi:TetR/AcrR family transcriptional regulator, cholesterol catabolism regulator
MALDATRPPERTANSERVLASMMLPAAAIVREKGILGSSVEDLVAAVGVSKGKLYYHIRTKEGLLFWIHESVTEEGYERWAKVIQDTSGASAMVTLRRLIEEHCAVVAEYRDCVAVISEEMKHLPPDLQEQIRRRRAEYQRLLESVLQRGIDEGVVRPVDVHLTASMILGTLNAMYRWYKPQGRRKDAEITATAVAVLISGLAEPDSAAGPQADTRRSGGSTPRKTKLVANSMTTSRDLADVESHHR